MNEGNTISKSDQTATTGDRAGSADKSTKSDRTGTSGEQNDIKLLLEQDAQQHQDVMTALNTLIEQFNVGDTASDATSKDISLIVQKLDTIIENQKDIVAGSNVVSTYGVLYFPFFIIVFLLWRFFSTFMKTYR